MKINSVLSGVILIILLIGSILLNIFGVPRMVSISYDLVAIIIIISLFFIPTKRKWCSRVLKRKNII